MESHEFVFIASSKFNKGNLAKIFAISSLYPRDKLSGVYKRALKH
jgi:hypothetical protein